MFASGTMQNRDTRVPGTIVLSSHFRESYAGNHLCLVCEKFARSKYTTEQGRGTLLGAETIPLSSQVESALFTTMLAKCPLTAHLLCTSPLKLS